MEQNLGNIEEDKLIDLEIRSRRNNLRLDGIKDRPNETWEDCENEIETLFKEILGIEQELVTERAHRVKTDKNKKSNTPRKIDCRILNYEDKVKILRNAKKVKGKKILYMRKDNNV